MKQTRGGYGCGVAIILTFMGMIAGLVLGPIFGNRETQSIADAVRSKNPNDPLDMLPIISAGYTLMCVVCGTVAGAILGITFYLKETAPGKNEEEG